MQQPTNLDFVSIQVVDMQKSEDFYSKALGFKKGISPNPHAIVFETGAGSIFAIRTPMPGFEHAEVRGAGIALWFRVSDADELYNRLVDEDVPIIKPIEDGPFGRVFILRDPDGYAITIHNDQ
ncbi:VOC family protein [Methylophilus sp. 14]|uniref:VOC family protein n=1 Tax=Methylophilus sp. 14 TaxID=2781019 RepID=UPI00188F4AE4|nr:VOC family protein [Methylophilus sp. 14]MBF4988154.1 VOC family protein [Methylophilus sp. 14]